MDVIINSTSNRCKKRFPAQALVEIAVLLPILLVLIIGAMDFGRMFFTKIVLTNAAREGVSYLSRNPTDKENCVGGVCYSTTLQVIQEEANSSGVTVSNGEVSFVDCCTAGNPVTVTITKNANLIFGSVLQAFGIPGNPLQLESTVRMVVQ